MVGVPKSIIDDGLGFLGKVFNPKGVPKPPKVVPKKVGGAAARKARGGKRATAMGGAAGLGASMLGGGANDNDASSKSNSGMMGNGDGSGGSATGSGNFSVAAFTSSFKKPGIISLPGIDDAGNETSSDISVNTKPSKKDGCCEQTLKLISECVSTLNSIRDLSVQEIQGITNLRTTADISNVILASMDSSIKKLYGIQAGQMLAGKENEAEKTAGLGGWLEAANDARKEGQSGLLSSILLMLGMSIGPMIDKLGEIADGFLKEKDAIGDGINAVLDPIKNFLGLGEDKSRDFVPFNPNHKDRDVLDVTGAGLNNILRDQFFLPPINMDPAQVSHLGGNTPLPNLIGAVESDPVGGYNAWNRTNGMAGRKNRIIANSKDGDGTDFSKVSFDQVRALQEKGTIFAAGRYQITPETMDEVKKSLKLKGDEAFDDTLQDYIFREHFIKKDPIIMDYLTGRTEGDAARDAALAQIAKIWAGMPSSLPEKRGGSHYGGVGQNEAGATLNLAKMAIDMERKVVMAVGGPGTGATTERYDGSNVPAVISVGTLNDRGKLDVTPEPPTPSDWWSGMFNSFTQFQ